MENNSAKLLIDGVFKRHEPEWSHSLTVLSDDKWRSIFKLADLHRLTPLWMLSLKQHGLVGPLPTWVAERIRWTERRNALRTLDIRRELAILNKILVELRVDALTLKGSALGLCDYPSPSLRPMRDIDLWVPYANLPAVLAALQAQGYTPLYEPAVVASCRESDSIEFNLLSPRKKFLVEIHSGLLRHLVGADRSMGLIRQQDLLRRSINTLPMLPALKRLAPSDMLLHMICHGVMDHQLDNGPLMIVDIKYILTTHNIDWTEFWRAARSIDATQAAVLALSVYEYLMPSQHVDWREVQSLRKPSESQLEQAVLLMVRDWRKSGASELWSKLTNRLRGVFRWLPGSYKEARAPVRRTGHVVYGQKSALTKLWRRRITQALPSLWSSAWSAEDHQYREYLKNLSIWLDPAL
jgi:Uncharacterised nucleotidyltransferase